MCKASAKQTSANVISAGGIAWFHIRGVRKNLAGLSRQFAASANRRFQFKKRRQLFVSTDDESLSVLAVHSNIAFDFVELKLDAVLHNG